MEVIIDHLMKFSLSHLGKIAACRDYFTSQGRVVSQIDLSMGVGDWDSADLLVDNLLL